MVNSNFGKDLLIKLQKLIIYIYPNEGQGDDPSLTPSSLNDCVCYLQSIQLIYPKALGEEKPVYGGLACYSKLLSLEVATVLDSS